MNNHKSSGKIRIQLATTRKRLHSAVSPPSNITALKGKYPKIFKLLNSSLLLLLHLVEQEPTETSRNPLKPAGTQQEPPKTSRNPLPIQQELSRNPLKPAGTLQSQQEPSRNPLKLAGTQQEPSRNPAGTQQEPFIASRNPAGTH